MNNSMPHAHNVHAPVRPNSGQAENLDVKIIPPGVVHVQHHRNEYFVVRIGRARAEKRVYLSRNELAALVRAAGDVLTSGEVA